MSIRRSARGVDGAVAGRPRRIAARGDESPGGPEFGGDHLSAWRPPSIPYCAATRPADLQRAAGRHAVLPLLSAFLRKEADAVYHVRSWLNEIDIPDSHIRAKEPSGGGAIRSPDKMDLYLLEERVIIEVRRPGRLSGWPREKDTGSGRYESAYEQISGA